MTNLRSHINELAGCGVSLLGVVTANQEQVEWWLRCTASLVAIVAGLLTVRSLLKRKPE